MDFSLLETKLVWAGQRVIDRSTSSGPMAPDDIPAWFIRRGSLCLRIEDELTRAKAGYWVFPKRGTGWVDFADGTILYSLRFRLRWPNGKDLFERAHTLMLRDRAYENLRKAAEALVVYHPKTYPPVMEMPASPKDFFSRELAFDLWLETYAKAAMKTDLRICGPGEKDRRLTRIRERLDELELAQRVSRGDLAAQAGMSVAQLNRRFRTEYGVTPRRYFERRRFAWVRGELAYGERTIKEIAGEAGFSNPAQFSNWMVRLAGISPLKYRRQVQM